MTSPTQGEAKRYYLDGNDLSTLAGSNVVLASDHDATVARLQAELSAAKEREQRSAEALEGLISLNESWMRQGIVDRHKSTLDKFRAALSARPAGSKV